MKKFVGITMAALFGVSLFALSSCGEAENGEKETSPVSVQVVAPDGAPSLSLAKMLSSESDGVTSYSIVDSSTIATYVNGKKDTVELCILPVNAAAKILGDGETYQMIGSVTHGNLFLLSSRYSEMITSENISSLAGKTVGVVNLANVPGLVFKSILTDYGISYNDLGNDGVASETSVNLKAIEGTDVGAMSEIDYYVAPEPAASAKVGALKAKNGLDFVGDLQALYGEEGYVQAVLVGKKDFIRAYPDYIEKFTSLLTENAAWIRSASAETVVQAISSHATEGMMPTFNAKNLTADVVAHCGIRFVAAKDCKEETLAVLNKFMAIDASSAKTVGDAFFYCPEK